MTAKFKVAADSAKSVPASSITVPQLDGDGLDEAQALLRFEHNVNVVNALAATKKAEHFFSTGFARP